MNKTPLIVNFIGMILCIGIALWLLASNKPTPDPVLTVEEYQTLTNNLKISWDIYKMGLHQYDSLYRCGLIDSLRYRECVKVIEDHMEMSIHGSFLDDYVVKGRH